MRFACSIVLLGCSVIPVRTAHAQVADDAVPALVREAVQAQLQDYQPHAWGLQYRVHRLDSKDDTIREVIETPDGNVSRTLTWHGHSLTPEQWDGERTRLQSLTLAELHRRRDKADASDKYAVELIRSMPTAMLYAMVPGQPQIPGYARPQVVFDFTPNPAFQPTSTAQSLLTGVAGRLWIDAETHHVSRIDLHVTRNLNLMFGILARVYEGGTLSYEQRPAAPGVHCYSHLAMDVKLRELMLHTAPYKQTITVSDVRFLPTAPTMKEAVATLLALPPVTQ